MKQAVKYRTSRASRVQTTVLVIVHITHTDAGQIWRVLMRVNESLKAPNGTEKQKGNTTPQPATHHHQRGHCQSGKAVGPLPRKES